MRDVEALSGLSRAKRLRSLSLNLSINALNAGDTQACGAEAFPPFGVIRKRLIHTVYFFVSVSLFASMFSPK